MDHGLMCKYSIDGRKILCPLISIFESFTSMLAPRRIRTVSIQTTDMGGKVIRLHKVQPDPMLRIPTYIFAVTASAFLGCRVHSILDSTLI
jgi:hypothetical protein